MKLLDQLKQILKSGDEPTEDSTEYDGMFSYGAESHAFVIGLYAGFIDFRDWKGLDARFRENPDVEKEPHYAHGGYMIGAVIRLLIVAGASIFVVTN